MKFLLVLILSVSNLTSVWACNITEAELVLRVAVLQANRASLMRYKEPVDFPYDRDENISKRDFNRLIDSVKKVYSPIFRKEKLNLRIEQMWEDSQVNAFAGARGNDRYVLLYGGYARHKSMTKDAFISVICHEIGHHLGGFPKKTSSSWSSSEGQADYFSTLKCMKEVLKRDSDNKEAALELDLPEEVKKQCKFQFPEENDYFICLRSSKAAEDHGKVISDLVSSGENSDVSLLNPSKEIRFETNIKHPSPQCRVDTKYQGALCNVSTREALDDLDETKGACHFNNFNIIGNRPACWFVHKK